MGHFLELLPLPCSAMRRVPAENQGHGTLLMVSLGQEVLSGHGAAARHCAKCIYPLTELSWPGSSICPCSLFILNDRNKMPEVWLSHRAAPWALLSELIWHFHTFCRASAACFSVL